MTGAGGLEITTATLADHVRVTADGRRVGDAERLSEIVDLAVLTEALGLDGFAVGEHHTDDFAVFSPTVVLAAIGARTERIRLGTAVTVLSANDPVRLQEDFATLDQLSSGRAEITVGRGAFVEPFLLYGVPIEDYDAVFEEKLRLLLQLQEGGTVTWSGRYRPPIPGLRVGPEPVQGRLPVWIGVGGTPASAARAGALGLPMIIGSIAMPLEQVAYLAEVYRAAGREAGTSERLRLGVGMHLFAAGSDLEARGVYPYYRDFLGPKRPGGTGLNVSPDQFNAGFDPEVIRAVGDTEALARKLARLHGAVRFDRLQVLPDWGGLPRELMRASLRRFTAEVAPAIRALRLTQRCDNLGRPSPGPRHRPAQPRPGRHSQWNIGHTPLCPMFHHNREPPHPTELARRTVFGVAAHLKNPLL